MTHAPHSLLAGRRPRWAVALAVALGLAVGTTAPAAGAVPVAGARATASSAPADTGAPTLVPEDGAYLEGSVEVAAEPTEAGDPVTQIAVDGEPVAGLSPTTGTSRLMFDVGSNSTEARYRNHVLVNGEHRIDLPDAVNERVTLEVPNDVLVRGENTVRFVAGTIEAGCGVNHDDFQLSDIGLVLLGEVADGEQNEFLYAFGDGSCGSNPNLLLTADLVFNITGDPRGTTGLAGTLDTTALDNGAHELSATTESGLVTRHAVRVNNAPAGAPVITPADGTTTRGRLPVIAAAPSGEVTELTVDGATPPMPEVLAPGTATLAFNVGSNSIEAQYFNHLLVNGHRVDIGGTWASERAEIRFPNHFLVPGQNQVKWVVGDINGTVGGVRCPNLDDYDVSNVVLTPATGTATGSGLQASYSFGDGTCGSNTSRLRTADLAWTIDGATTSTLLPTLAHGEARLSMFIGGNGSEARYRNYVRINGMQVFLDDVVGATTELVFPNEWLVPGTNTVEIMAGTFPTSCGDNHDDFPVTELALAPASGAATLRMKQTTSAGAVQPISIGDGNCGDNHNPTTGVAVPFTVDAPAGGLRADVDTAALPDGRHTISATSAAGTATRTVVTDNTAPEITSSTPAAGAVITEPVVFDAVVEDFLGVVGEPTYTLDGAPLAVGEEIGPGLSAGDHVIAVEAADGLGNEGRQEITFRSASIPEVPAELEPQTGADDLSETVTLSARVAEPGGGEVTAEFRAAEVVKPAKATSGTLTEIPSTLAIDGETAVEVDGLAPLDDAVVDSPSTRDISFQRYDLAVPAGAGPRPLVRWTGILDPERRAVLRVWDPAAARWVALAGARGVFDGDTVLSARVAPSYVDDGVVHVLVTGEDPFADDLEPRGPDAFADPADYDFSLVHFTDTQYLSEGAVEQETAAERAIWRAAYGAITDWVADNAGERKVAHVMHTGDIIENNINPTTPEQQQQVHGEFAVASELHETLDAAGIPSQVIAGNHDNMVGRDTGPESTYNDYFGPQRYQAAAQQWGEAQYGGPWREGDNQNNYVLFSAGGLEFIVVGLSYGITRAEAAWADGILKQYSDRNAILLTHDYVQPSTRSDGRGGVLAGDGAHMYRRLVEPNPNVFLILAGHHHGVATNVKPDTGVVGRGVVELLADYQFYTVSAERLGLTEIGGYQPNDQLRFGASFLRLLQVDVDRSELTVDTYSPFLEEFGATEYDDRRRYDGTEDDMVLPIDLETRTTSFATDAVSLFVQGDEIGTATVPSGQVASVEWTGLVPGTVHGWVVTSRSADGGRVSAEPGVFRTAGVAVPVDVAGTVTSAAGGPVAGACVYLYSSPEAEAAAYASCGQADGEFGLLGVEPGDYTVAVADPAGAHRTWWSPEPVTVHEGMAALEITMEVAADGALAGEVSNGTEPVAGVCAYAYPAGTTDAAVAATCAAGDGTYWMSMAAADYDVAFFDPAGTYPTAWENGVSVTAGQTTTLDKVLAADATGTVSGVVTGPAGPVAGACVYLYPAGDTSAARHATCVGADGSYWIGAVEPGDYQLAVADPSGTHATTWRDLAVAGPTTADVTMAASRGGVTGHVTGTAGTPVGGACVYLYPADVTAAASYASCAGTDGSYLVPDVDAADYDVAFFDPSATYATQWWTGAHGGAATQTGAVPVSVATTLVGGIDASLAPAG